MDYPSSNTCAPVPNLASQDLDISLLLFDLKLCSELVNRFVGWLEPRAIAACATDGLIEQFGCAFARIWLITPDRSALTLVASAGLYTRLDGSFSRVPMGAFKVGKIAQHCIPFLSNCLSEEVWVKDRNWAITNKIQGFAGLPLMVKDQAIGVLAVFSHNPMAPEFLEVLQMLSLSVTGALASAMNHQALQQSQLPAQVPTPKLSNSLSEALAALLGRQKLSLLGTEQALAGPVTQLLLKVGQQLADLPCHYCRLVYEADTVVLEAILAINHVSPGLSAKALAQLFQAGSAIAQALGGSLQTQVEAHKMVGQIRLQLPQAVDTAKKSQLPPVSPLSDREQEVIVLLAQGCRDREIARQLFISERTVKFHTKNMLAKLGVKTRIQAVFEATQQGWLTRGQLN